MNSIIRILLFPLSLLWGSIAWIRRWYFNSNHGKRRFKSSIPTLLVGNLTVGGTGKTPMIIHLVEELKKDYCIAVLSRGYGRKTKGFREVSADNHWSEVGDEPLEIKRVSNCLVFVCEHRVLGMKNIQELYPEVNLVLLDDGYQHLQFQSTCSIILSDYNRMFYADKPLPAGRLREFPSAVAEASMVVVSKCPSELELPVISNIHQRIQEYKQGIPVFFAEYKTTAPQYSRGLGAELQDSSILITGVVGGEKVKQKLESQVSIVKHFNYADHAEFSQKDVQDWLNYCEKCNIKSLIFTRKDLMRLGDLLPEDVLNKNGLTVFEIHTTVEILNSESLNYHQKIIQNLK